MLFCVRLENQSYFFFYIFKFRNQQQTEMDSSMAMKTFELSNNIDTVQSADEIYKYSKEEQQGILQRKPWKKE